MWPSFATGRQLLRLSTRSMVRNFRKSGMARIDSYRQLDVWKLAMTLAHACYRVTTEFPKEELYGLTAQIRRAAVSIAANIAEGHNRRSRGAYRYHISVALGSQAELGTLLDLVEILGYRGSAAMADVKQEVVRAGMMLHALARAL